MSGIVYALSNPAMPKYIKIGKTTREDPTVRINELYTTGVPVPFECIIAVRVADETHVERTLHVAFGPQRLNPQREFFEIEAEQVIALLKLIGDEDVTPEVSKGEELVDDQSREAARRLKSRRPNMNYYEMGFKGGEELHFQNSGEAVIVAGPRKVLFQGEEMSLTAVTRKLLELDYNIQPGPHWFSNGKSINEIYDETYPARNYL